MARNEHVVAAAVSRYFLSLALMEQDEQLIDLVKTYPCLYDTKSADFKVNLKKENAWKAISNALARPGE